MKQLVVWVAFATLFTQINAEKFSCEGRASGYYADLDTGCQVYHMCDGLGRQFSYSCPNTTLFQQRMLICDHWYMVNCSKSESDYKANLLIGQRDKPFVEDSFEHPYHRTPRPDLLQQPYAPRYQDDEYRQGRAQSASSSLNLVGVATDDDAEDELGNRKNFTTDRPQYFLPSHWSTQYGKIVTTPIPPNNNIKSFISKSPVIPEKKLPNTDFKNLNVPPRKQPPQNFNNRKYFKAPPKVVVPTIATTPDFRNSINPRVDNIPDSLNQESVSPSSLALPPFIPNQPQIVPNPQRVPSTPRQQPQLIEKSSSQFPQQSTLVTIPPQKISQRPDTSFNTPSPGNNRNVDISNIPKPSIYYQPPKLSSTFDVESSTMDPQSLYKLIPSKELLPPPLLPQIIPAPKIPTNISHQTEKTKKATNEQVPRPQIPQVQHSDHSEKRWKELRQMFFIPEYDFPLEVGNRPSYESGLSSFQVNSAPPIPEAFRRRETKSGSSFQEGNQQMNFPQTSRGINPECPKCDPAFLAPGTCKPCVMIRR